MGNEMTTVTLRRSGNSLNFNCPKDVVAAANLHEGDKLHVQVVHGRIVLTPFDPDFQEAIEAIDDAARQYRNAYAELSKK
jgi:putative addiction module antidote